MPYVKSRCVSTDYKTDIFWDAPNEIMCLNCEKTLADKDAVHICKIYMDVHLPACSCYMDWGRNGLDFFNLSKEGLLMQCYRCTRLPIPVEDWRLLPLGFYTAVPQ